MVFGAGRLKYPENNIAQAKREMENVIDDLAGVIADLQREISENEDTIKTLNTRIADLEYDLDCLKESK